MSQRLRLVTLFSFSSVFALLATIAWAEVKLEGVACLFADKPAKAEHAVDYKGGKVFFCCPNCPKNFSKEPVKHAVKANLQLVATKQAKQTACPISGRDVDASKTVKIGGIEVGFCCDGCKGKAEKTEGDDAKKELVFSDAAFAKGFKVETK